MFWKELSRQKQWFVNAQDRRQRVNVRWRRDDGCVFQKTVKHLCGGKAGQLDRSEGLKLFLEYTEGRGCWARS